jgi:hypothetical protein
VAWVHWRLSSQEKESEIEVFAALSQQDKKAELVRERDKETKEAVKERVKQICQGRKYLQRKPNKICLTHRGNTNSGPPLIMNISDYRYKLM